MSGPASQSAAVPVLAGIGSLMEGYDGVILDLWGVVHDGRAPYPGAEAALRRMMAAGKKVVMLSNAPRRAKAVIDGMTAMGLDQTLYSGVLSSGELTWAALRRRDDDWLEALGHRCLHVGPDRDLGLLDGLELETVTGPEAGAFILNTGPWRDEETLADYQDLLTAAAGLKMPMVCANPDMEVIRAGKRIICAGTLAAHYQTLGGAVRSYGKPYPDTYDACLTMMGLTDTSRLIAIGDSFATDIAGANAAGVDAVLVTSGIHGSELGLAYGETPDGVQLAAVCRAKGARLKAAIAALVW